MTWEVQAGLEQIDFSRGLQPLYRLIQDNQAQMSPEDWAYVADRLEGMGQVGGLELLQNSYGYDCGKQFDQLLQNALVLGQETNELAEDGRMVPLADHVARLVKGGADPLRVEGAYEMALKTKKPEAITNILHRATGRPHMDDPADQTVQTGALSRALDGAGSAQDSVSILSASSGREWKRHDETGRVYLEVPTMAAVAEVSSALSRHGVSMVYGGQGIIDNKTAVVIPESIIESVPETNLRNAGDAAGLALRNLESTSPRATTPNAAGVPAKHGEPLQTSKGNRPSHHPHPHHPHHHHHHRPKQRHTPHSPPRGT